MGKVLDNRCPHCNAPIAYNPTLKKFKCEYCDSEFTAKELKDMEKLSKEKVVVENEYDIYNCPDCGAEIIADKNTAATFCLYCGNYSIIKSRLTGEFAPSKIIPFKKDKEEAIKAFKSLRKGRPLLPDAFSDQRNIEKITGLYIPFWLYDISTNGTLEADCKQIRSWTRGDTHYTKTDTYDVSRSGEMLFEKVPVDGSTRFDNDIMNTIEPFDYSELEDYNHAYLSGFLAEKYDVSESDAFKDAEERSKNSTRMFLDAAISNYTVKVVRNCNVFVTKEKSEYVMLPVWMVNVKFMNKMYLFAMNGQTGEFIGNMPVDKKKAVMWGIFVFVLSFVIVTLISLFMYYGLGVK